MAQRNRPGEQVHTSDLADSTSVLVIGAGPVGLTLALELDHHGVDVIVAERNLTSTSHPKMDITNGRSMELFRRLGVTEELRKVAIPGDHRMTVTWATSAFGPDLASFVYPSVDEQYEAIQASKDGTLALEPSMRVSQVILEPALRDLLSARSPRAQLLSGWALDDFVEDANGVTCQLVSPETGERRVVRAKYLVGCDGAGSRTRQKLGIALQEIDLRKHLVKQLGVRRTVASLVRTYKKFRQRPMDGRFYLVHFSTSDQRILDRIARTWHLQSPMGWVLISQNDVDTFTLHVPLGIGTNADGVDPAELVRDCLGFDFDMEIHVANAWKPRLVVADSFGRRRVWLAGDAVHQVTPTGGYGMNTGVGDAVGLGWALAANVQGWGGPALLTAYEQERRAVAFRNRESAARHTTVRAAIMTTDWTSMADDSWSGELVQRRLGREIRDLGNLENEAWGIELGYRYDSSVVCSEPPGNEPPQPVDRYVPSTWPGARPPSVILGDGKALFDQFGRGFTLLRFADRDTDAFVQAADERGLPLDVVDVRDQRVRQLYERDLVLIRPDQHVAWRSDEAPRDPGAVIDRVRGALQVKS